jgi:hypothetical protein
MALDIEEVRRMASAAGLEETYYNEQSRVVSFAPTDVDQEAELSRINVYYTTGTVGTCIHHPRQGRTQLFRRNVSLTMLPQIFRDPRIHTGTGYHRRVRQRRATCAVCLFAESRVTLRPCGHDQLCMGCADQLPRRDGRLTCPICRAECIYAPREEGNPLAEEYEAEAALALLRAEESELQARIQAVQAVISAANERRAAEARRQEEERQRAAAAAAAAEQARQAEQRRQQEQERQAQLERERAARGSRIKYALLPKSKETIDNSFGSTTLSVALNDDDGAFVIQEGGGFSYSAGMPDGLYELMQQEKKKRRNKRTPSYVALGSRERYYVRFTDGSSQWSGDGEDFNQKIRDGGSRGGISSVAFGEPGAWFIVYGDGGWSNLCNCPGLNNKIAARDRRGDLKCVSLGPNGEWFLAAGNGRIWWGGYSDVSKLPEQIQSVKNRITYMDFADDDTFLVRYE